MVLIHMPLWDGKTSGPAVIPSRAMREQLGVRRRIEED